MDAPHRLSVAGLAAAYVAGQLTPEGVLDHMFARIRALDPELRAFIELNREGASRSAAESFERIRARAPRVLEGVPVAIKANIAVQNLEWAAGMEALRGRIAETDAVSVRRLRNAGAMILGTLNMEEAALGAATDNPWYGRAFNPHGRGRTPGGSSGGSGAAVAAGLCTIALGSDTLGSVRIPAAYCGVFGLKPTNGLLPSDGLEILAERFDCIGPLARGLDDLEAASLALGLVEGEGNPPERYVSLADLGDLQPAVASAYKRAAAFLEPTPLALPHELKRIRLAGFYASARELGERSAHLDQEKLSERLRFLIGLGNDRTESDRAADEAIFEATATKLRGAVEGGAVILMPTAPQAAFAQEAHAPENQADFTALANIAGLPALSLPAGTDPDGMPVAVQLVGRPGSEAELIAAARRLAFHIGNHGPPPQPFW